MSEFIPLRTALGRIEAKLLVNHGVSIERPIALGAHPLIEHLLSHGTPEFAEVALQPVKGCKLCALFKAHQLLSDAIEEDEGLQIATDAELEALDLRKEAAFQRWLRLDLDPEEPDR